MVFQITNENDIENLILVARWTYYTDGNYFGKKLQYLNLKPSRSSNKSLSRKAFKKGLQDTLEVYEKQKTNIFLIEQAPFQSIDAKKIYYRSFNNDSAKFTNNLIKYSIDSKKHNNLQKFVTEPFKYFSAKYNNLTLINLNNIFCDEKIKKCLIGNEKYSFYTDINHLSVNGTNLASDKINNFIEKF